MEHPDAEVEPVQDDVGADDRDEQHEPEVSEDMLLLQLQLARCPTLAP